jgi:hypothetical protein
LAPRWAARVAVGVRLGVMDISAESFSGVSAQR